MALGTPWLLTPDTHQLKPEHLAALWPPHLSIIPPQVAYLLQEVSLDPPTPQVGIPQGSALELLFL